MGTMTAQILVGESHPYQGGIIPSHMLFLSENSRPAWTLKPLLFDQDRANDKKEIVWIPTVDHMLEDALLMIALHIQQDHELIQLAKSLYRNALHARVELYESFDVSQRMQLYEKCRMLSEYPKIIISVFNESTIKDQLQVLNGYQMESEVCCSND